MRHAVVDGLRIAYATAGAGPLSHVEAPLKLNDRVRSFLRSVEG